jgi:site-specific DNA-methyltransferase (adenine-specific)
MLEVNQIHQGDCLELMKSIPTGSIDMILCDLPYGTTACEWDSIIDMGQLWNEYQRIIKDNGAIVLTANSVFTFQLWESNKKLFKYKMVWDKNFKVGFMDANRRPMRQYEDVLIFYKKPPVYNPQKSKGDKYIIKRKKNDVPDYMGNISRIDTINNEDRYPSDIIKINSNVFSKDKGMHPTQKPVELFEYLIKTYTNENDLVLDNCSGSGTTAIACLNSNRQFICIEQNEEYVRKSRERLLDHEPLLNLNLSH